MHQTLTASGRDIETLGASRRKVRLLAFSSGRKLCEPFFPDNKYCTTRFLSSVMSRSYAPRNTFQVPKILHNVKHGCQTTTTSHQSGPRNSHERMIGKNCLHESDSNSCVTNQTVNLCKQKILPLTCPRVMEFLSEIPGTSRRETDGGSIPEAGLANPLRCACKTARKKEI